MALTFKKLRKVNMKRLPIAFPNCINWIVPEWGNAAAGEMGEACNKIKKLYSRKNKHVSVNSIAEELADTIIYLDLLAESMGIDLESAIVRKFNKVSKKKKCSIVL